MNSNGGIALAGEAANGGSWHPLNRSTFAYAEKARFKISKCRAILAKRPRYSVWTVDYEEISQSPNMNNVAGQLHPVVFVARG